MRLSERQRRRRASVRRKREESRAMTTITIDDAADCEAQGMGTTDHCVIWGCENTPLELRGEFWVCPSCNGSYGKDAKEAE